MISKNDMEENNSPVAENSQSEILKKIKHNPWMGSTAVLGVIVIILLATMFYPNLTGNVVSGSNAGASVDTLEPG